MSTRYHIIPIFVPHTGCPHDCVFCNQRKITGVSTNITKDDVKEIIETYLQTIPQSNEKLEIAFYGGSFTGIESDVQKELLSIAFEYKKRGTVDRIRLSTRPDYIDDERLLLLKDHGVDIIELGVQSMDEEVLEKSYRGHTSDDVRKAVKLIREYDFYLGLQMMMGLPKDTREKILYTTYELLSLHPDFVRIYPTLVITDTYLEKQYLNGEYKPLTLEEAVSIATDVLMIFENYNIKVIRIGLQPSDNVAEGKEIVSGPFHSSFRQLVESNIYRHIMSEVLKDINTHTREIKILIGNKEISNLAGQRSSNIDFLKETFNLKKILIKGDNIPKDYFYIQTNNKSYKIDRKKYINNYLKQRDLLKLN
ncbi:radical SAM domain protein [Gottschalkia purinilytica]|uniref:Radical SAM domain protein n=1 Tax=Gottschalkia purinilytica TaxID=1503 RepID=A0A0L0WB76_GOTPU|nr:radical SAM protein [Gottschalkia purinilytica]KNF08779.1 radical SAM domain protein [Gottschalkia purinilytica]